MLVIEEREYEKSTHDNELHFIKSLLGMRALHHHRREVTLLCNMRCVSIKHNPATLKVIIELVVNMRMSHSLLKATRSKTERAT